MITEISSGYDCWGKRETDYRIIDIPSSMTIEQQYEFAEELRRRYPDCEYRVTDPEAERREEQRRKEEEIRKKELAELARLKAKYE